MAFCLDTVTGKITSPEDVPVLVLGPVDVSWGRGDFAGGVKLRPLRWGGPSIPRGGPASSQGPYKREAGGSEAEGDGRCCAAGCEDAGGAASQGCGASRSWKRREQMLTFLWGKKRCPSHDAPPIWPPALPTTVMTPPSLLMTGPHWTQACQSQYPLLHPHQ